MIFIKQTKKTSLTLPESDYWFSFKSHENINFVWGGKICSSHILWACCPVSNVLRIKITSQIILFLNSRKCTNFIIPTCNKCTGAINPIQLKEHFTFYRRVDMKYGFFLLLLFFFCAKAVLVNLPTLYPYNLSSHINKNITKIERKTLYGSITHKMNITITRRRESIWFLVNKNSKSIRKESKKKQTKRKKAKRKEKNYLLFPVDFMRRTVSSQVNFL